MKKKGFTLSEVIVAIGVIGVIAAITAPMLGSIIPDKDKVLVLKAYKTLNDLNKELLDNHAYYWIPSDSDCVGFSCQQEPLAPDLKNKGFSGAGKYPLLLAHHMSLDGAASATSFKTIDGITWTFSGDFSSTTSLMTVKIDLKDDANSVEYSPGVKNPDTFSFEIDTRGFVYGKDALTKAYLANPHKFNDKRADYRAAGG